MKRAPLPFWVFLVSVALASIDPIQHLWLEGFLPEDQAHTGFHIGDTPFFLTSMDIFSNEFHSPYAPCDAEANDWHRFALPHHWLYGALGWWATSAEVSHFRALGIANGICGFFYLLAVWLFLQRWRPAIAPTAFSLFALGGGLAGWFYLGAASFGMDTAPGFEGWFHRYARYELIEGPFLSPVLVMPRLYYTLPLVLGFIALRMLLREMDGIRVLRSGMLLLLFLLVTLLNARLGPFFYFAAACLLYSKRSLPMERRIGLGLALAIPVVIGVVGVGALFTFNPSGSANVAELLRRAAWFGSVASALFWFWPLIAWALFAHARAVPLAGRVVVFAAAGYLTAFAVGYGYHQVYWGNLFAGGDTAAAIAVSNYALLGALPGAALALLLGVQRRPQAAVSFAEQAAQGAGAVENTTTESRRVDSRDEANTAALLWFFVLLAVSISAFGRDGEFMRLMPERCLVMLGVPLAAIAADRLLRLGDESSLRAGLWFTLILVSGLVSLVVGALCFQGPYRHGFDADAPFAWVHSEVMPVGAARMIAEIGDGVLLAPVDAPPFLGDVAVHAAPGRSTVFGQPSLEFSDRNMLALADAVQIFYRPGTAESERRAFVDEQCVDWIVVTPGIFAADFKRMAWLEVTHSESGYHLFRVRKDAL